MSEATRECLDCGDTYVPGRDAQRLCTDCASAHRDALGRAGGVPGDRECHRSRGGCGLEGTVSHWRTGDRSPETKFRLLLREACDIPLLAWDEPARGHDAAH